MIVGLMIVSAAVMAGGITLGPGLAAAKKPAKAPAPQRVLAFAKEYELSLSKRRFFEGRIRLQLKNIGEDDHDLVIRNAAGRIVARSKLAHSGDLTEVRATLKPGRYRVYCSLTGHVEHGMTTDIVVVKRPAPKAAKRPDPKAALNRGMEQVAVRG